MLAASTAALVAADMSAAFSLDFLMWGWDEVSKIVLVNDFEALEDRQNPRGLAYSEPMSLTAHSGSPLYSG